jgi:ribonuclease HI
MIGSCIYLGISFPGTGGYGIVLFSENAAPAYLAGGYRGTSVNRLYVHGLIGAIKGLPPNATVKCYLNNNNVIETLNKGWLETWHRRQYAKTKNPDLWRQVYLLIKERNISLSMINDQEAPDKQAVKRAKQLAENIACLPSLLVDIGNSESAGGMFVESTEEENKPSLENSVCVDASCIGNPGIMEYQCVDTKTEDLIFKSPQFPEGTNNIGEFLAIVQALGINERDKKGWQIIYSDSQIAIGWIEQKKCKTKLEANEKNAELFDLIRRAETWLVTHFYNAKVIKWNSLAWGEIPADYGRK